MGACFHTSGVQCDNCRTALNNPIPAPQHPFIPDDNIVVSVAFFGKLLAELNEHKENAIKATGLLVEARRDFVLVADALGLVSTDDTGRIGAVAPIEEVVEEARLAASALAKQAELFEALSMSCETPPEGCDCAGCSYAREKGGDHNT